MSEFPEQLPHGELQQIFPDIFFVSGQNRPNFNGQDFQFSRNMTVVREGNELTLLNTLRLDEDGLSKLDALGIVKHIVKLGAFHGRDDAFYLDRYQAKMWAAPGMPHERGVSTDIELTHDQSGPISNASVFAFETSAMPETILCLNKEGGILISCDSLQNWIGPDEHFDKATADNMERLGFFNKANIGPGWKTATNPEVSDFNRLLELPFRHLLSAHGEPLLNDAKGAVEATVNRVFSGE